ncbi:alanine racemase [Candidatus Margulisiibacteriota bacterium]
MNSTKAEINLLNLKYNIGQIKNLLKPGTKFMAVVKANAYGHGAVEISKAAIDAGIDYLSVANIHEALELKDAGIDFPILILSEITKENVSDLVKNGFSQTVYTYELAEALSKEAEKQKRKVKVHFKVDTGMGRVGATDNAAELIKKVSALKGIELEGIFTHLARGEEPNGFTKEQIDKFLKVLKDAGVKAPLIHAANSAGTLYNKFAHLDMVRIGLSMYGLYPPGSKKDTVDLKPVMSFKTKVGFVKRVPKGTPISYGSTFVTDKETNIATLPVGYADGFSRALSNKGKVLIKGKEFPVVGRVCMDLTLVNSYDEKVSIGDEVVLIGKQGKEEITTDEVADLEGTVNYEVVCGIGKRVPRIYK